MFWQHLLQPLTLSGKRTQRTPIWRHRDQALGPSV
ncbi:MAG: hypothetical protein ETSY2_45575 [Candidatus Entotheonella gemina]|uniref:Uncharacterized protein n=1 Tax=Candidatus Entotheonella gemina TaxID=1429439 RepID=W4LG96_9BACT|nr:MAG: hypothetical protein ETSY2_45575 [Candidatus Entotheonella gemina]